MLDKIKNFKNQGFKKVSAKLPVGSGSERLIVGLDVGTEYVKALVAKVSGDELEVIGVGRAHQSLSDMQSGAIADIAGVVGTANEHSLRQKKWPASVPDKPLLVSLVS